MSGGPNEVSKNALPPIPGCDTDGHIYKSAEDMWTRELHGNLYDAETGWYGKSLQYWSKVPATVSGVLGGMEHIHDVDLKESRAFITSLPDRGTARALDCGAGIGRITKCLLSTLYTVTDLLEPVPNMLEKAKEELKGYPVGEFFLSSMEKAKLEANTYDLIVIQWTAIYLTDDDFVKFLAHCKTALTPKGYVFFKENCSSDDQFVVDKEDSSLTRSDAHYKRIFAAAGVTVVKETMQNEWPDELFKVFVIRIVPMMFDKPNLVPQFTADTALQETVENVLANSHSLLNNARRLSGAGPSGLLSLEEELVPGRASRAAPKSAVSESFGPALGAFHTQLEECRDLLRRVDSERRFFRERALEMQQALEEENKERTRLRAQIAESQRELRKAQRQAMEAQTRTREMEVALSAATEEQMHLRRFLRSLPVEKKNLLLLVPDRRFEEAFRDKMSAMKYKRRYDRARELFERRSEDAERKQMALEDDFVAETPQEESASSFPNAQLFESISLLSASTFPRLSASFSFSQLMSTSAARDSLHFPFQLPFSHVTAKDGYIDTQIQRSAYKEPLKILREGLFRLSHRLKRTQDMGLCNMYTVMLESLQSSGPLSSHALFDPKNAFEAAMEKLQKSHRELLYQLVELVNSSVVQLVENESRVTKKPSVSRRDVGCSVYCTTPMDLRMASLEMRLDAQRRKSASIGSDPTLTVPQARPNNKEIQEKARTTLQQLITLHDALHKGLQRVRSQCHLDKANPSGTVEDFSLAATDAFVEDPRYETKVAEVVEADVRQIAQLAELVLQTMKTPPLLQKARSSTSKSTGAAPTRRQRAKQQTSQMSFSSQANRIDGGGTVDTCLTHPTPSSTRATAFPRRSGGAGVPDNFDTAINTLTGAKDNGTAKMVPTSIVDNVAKLHSGNGSGGSISLPVSKPAGSFSLRVPLSSQRVVSSNLSRVTLPQFMGSEGAKR